MGLDAVVYRNVANADLGKDLRAVEVNPRTGEVYFSDEKIARRHQPNVLRAAEFRLGNAAEIGALSEEITRLLGQNTEIREQVLYSGSHSGDVIPTSALATLTAEIERIREAGSASQPLLLFLEKLEKLAFSARAEGNPIVFV